MKYCSFCGTQIDDDNAKFCPNCGKGTVAPQYVVQTANVVQDAPNAGFAVLSFFFPLIGLILYLVWNDTMPLRAKSCGKGALIGVIAYVGFIVLVFVLLSALASAVIGTTHYLY